MESAVNRIAFCAVLMLCCLLAAAPRASAQGNGVVTISVTNSPTNITVDRDCNYVIVRENSAAPTAVFSITLANTATSLNYAAGSQFQFTAQKAQFGSAGTFKSGTTIGTIVATASGPFSFVAVESYGEPSFSPKSSSSSGGGDTTAKYVLGAADSNLANAAVNSNAYAGADVAPASPTPYDCEFTSTACSFTTWGNQNSATAVVQNDHLILTTSNGGTGAASFIGESVPSPTYQFVTHVCLDSTADNYGLAGLALYESSTGKVEWAGFYTNSVNGLSINHGTLTGAINTVNQSSPDLYPNCTYVQVTVTATTIAWGFSGDGASYHTDYSHSITSSFTTAPNYIGLVASNYYATAISADFIRRTE
jgi:hypothetical protein